MPSQSPNRARPGGPKSPTGRAAVAKNAMTHGLTAARPATAAEAELVEDLRSALMAQYQPQGPLVKLQIDRIARVAAKLQRLQQIEDAAFELAHENALPSVQDIVAGMGPADAQAQAQAVRILQGSSHKATLGLDDAALAQLCDEIRASGYRVCTVADIEALLPKTYAFIHTESVRHETVDVGLQLQALVASLHPPTPPPSPARLPGKHANFAPDAELMTIINSGIASNNVGMAWVRVRPQNDPKALAQGLQDDLQALLTLQRHRLAVQDIVQRYPARRALLLRAAMPPADEADRLMRYHVALDRQLSKCMGELLQMNTMQP